MPEASEEFLARLRQFDPSLLVTWHRRRRRWVVEQCTRHFAPTARHTHVCQRVYVLTVEDPEGGCIPLGDHVFQRLAEIDTIRQGYGPDKHQKWCDDKERERQDQAERIDRKMTEAIRDNSRDNRRQLHHAYDLIQRHDLRINQ